MVLVQQWPSTTHMQVEEYIDILQENSLEALKISQS